LIEDTFIRKKESEQLLILFPEKIRKFQPKLLIILPRSNKKTSKN